jgi:hypothetical protein
MKAIEAENEDLKDVLPKNYQKIDKPTLFELLHVLSSIPNDLEGDVFGKIYEYFIGKFAMIEGQMGGEFFTPMRNWSGSMRRPVCFRSGSVRMGGRSLTGHNPDGVWKIVPAVSRQLSKQCGDNYPLSEWTIPVLMEKDDEIRECGRDN